MNYDAENDRFVSESGEMTIYPTAPTFPESESIEINFEDDTMVVPVDQINTLNAGLEQARLKVMGETTMNDRLYLIQGRLTEDDEDTVHVVEADSDGQAQAKFEEELRKWDQETDLEGNERPMIIVSIQKLGSAILARLD